MTIERLEWNRQFNVHRIEDFTVARFPYFRDIKTESCSYQIESLNLSKES